MSYDITYTPSGPVIQAFHQSDAFVRILVGPIGSGKSIGCMMDLMMHALNQPRGHDGWARSRAVILRNTYVELRSTSVKSWLEFFPESLFGKFSYATPLTHKMDLGDNRTLEVIFLAVDVPADVKKLLSLECSWAFLNESRELSKATLDAVTGRVGRFPSAKSGAGVYHPCVICDSNPPSDDHFIAQLDAETPSDWEIFHQPSGLSEEAENLAWLNQDAESIKLPLDHPDRRARGRIYYERLIGGKDKEWCEIYVHGKYGSTSSDRPVYPEFADKLHSSDQILQPYPKLPLYIGWDFGLTPACVIGQVSAKGQLRILDEVVCGFDGATMGLLQFITTQVKPLLAMKYAGYKIISLHDPAGTQRSQADEKTCRDMLKQQGMNPSSVGTNNFMPRRESVAYFLSRLIDGDPAFIMSSTVKYLRRGLRGEYSYQRIQIGGEARFRDEPKKNMVSHVNDALQYLALNFHTPGREDRKPRTHAVKKYQPASIAGY